MSYFTDLFDTVLASAKLETTEDSQVVDLLDGVALSVMGRGYLERFIVQFKDLLTYRRDLDSDTCTDEWHVVRKEQSKLFGAAGVALSGLFRHWAVAQKLPLLVHTANGRVRLYGKVEVVGGPDGLSVFENDQRLWWIESQPILNLAKALNARVDALAYRDACAFVLDVLRSKAIEDNLRSVDREWRSLFNELAQWVHDDKQVSWWGSRKTSAARVIGHALFTNAVVDKRTIGLAVRLSGSSAPVVTYNKVTRQKAEVVLRLREAPNLGTWLLGEHGELRVHDTVWKELKENAIAEGLHPQTWKWLCKQGYRLLSHLKPHELSRATITLLNDMASTQAGRLPWFRQLFSCMQTISPAHRGPLARLISREFSARKVSLQELVHLPMVTDYLRAHPSAELNRSSWSSLWRKQAQWHRLRFEQQAQQRREQEVRYQWSAACGELSLAKTALRSVELLTSDDLWEEGMVMQHCVSGYDHSCYEGHCRIFSIREAERHVATLEIRWDGKTWAKGQLYSACNTIVKSKDIQKLASQVLGRVKRQKVVPTAGVRLSEPQQHRPAPLPAMFVDLEEELPF